jgi:multidrug efflux pump subunit AcrB
VADGIYRYNIHFDNQILNVNDVKNIYIKHAGRLLQLKDICRIEERPALRKNIIRHSGKNCVTLAIIKQNDAQMADLKEAVDGVIDDLRENYPNMDFSITRDQTELLAYSINNLEWNLLAAAFFTSLVLLFFMRKWRLALLVACSIPLSLIITLLCFRLIGISLNIISLSGLILGVGMIVDNSIIDDFSFIL